LASVAGVEIVVILGILAVYHFPHGPIDQDFPNMNRRLALIFYRLLVSSLCAWLLPVSLLLAADQVTTSNGLPAAALTLQAQLPPVFDDHAVLQQGIPVPVWGTSLPRAKVSVRFSNQSKSTVAEKNGRWRVVLDPLPADRLDSVHKTPKGQTLSVVTELDGKKASRVFADILVGEVWLCSGQSNMAAKVRHNHANQDPKDNLLKSNFPAIRHICAPGGWQMATPQFVGEFTRVGFCFARKVHLNQKVPVGLVNACVGGSRIESWMRVPPPDLTETSTSKRNIQYGGLFRERFAPLVGDGLRGWLWYQGAANAGAGQGYFVKMKALINDWRALWKLGDVPFYCVQLAGIGHSPTDNPAMGDGRARIREAQRKVLSLKNTGMAVAVDIGSEKEHPANKVEVGERLAHWALHNDYGQKELPPSGPLYKGFQIEGSAIRVSFAYGQGLMFARKENYLSPVPVPDAKLPWLSIQAKDGDWHWADGKIEGTDLIVSGKNVTNPVAVRYAYTNRPLGVYLYNGAGLPTSPFTTEAEADDKQPK
jgi:sialate O-acetylesterase